jgi:predicted transposase YdaD
LAGHYDKILKENIAAIFLPLAEKFLGIHITKNEELKDKVQVTLEKEPDFIRIVETEAGERFILHIEFQRADEEGMVYRMQEYYVILRRKYNLPVRPIVFYLGQTASRMQTQLAREEVFEGFLLISLNQYSSRNLVSSQLPGEIILAILGDFEGQDPMEVVKDILIRLKETNENEMAFRKYIRQLSILARLRNLTTETQKQINDMGLINELIDNIAEDPLYQEGVLRGREEGIAKGILKGREEGMEKGILKGREEGMEKGVRNLIIKMLMDRTLTMEKIAEFAEVRIAYVEQVAKELND